MISPPLALYTVTVHHQCEPPDKDRQISNLIKIQPTNHRTYSVWSERELWASKQQVPMRAKWEVPRASNKTNLMSTKLIMTVSFPSK